MEIDIFRYTAGSSFLHRLDARTKLVIGIIFSILVLQAESTGLFILGCFVIGIVFMAKQPLLTLVAGLKPFRIIFAILFLLHLFSTPGISLISFIPQSVIMINVSPNFLPITPTDVGFVMGIVTVFRFAVLLIFAALLMSTTSPSQFNLSLEYFLGWLDFTGIRPRRIAFMVTMAMNFIPTILRDLHDIKMAQYARGYRGSPLKGFFILLVPLITKSIRRVDEVADAMEARCYHENRRSYYHTLRFEKLDVLAWCVFSGVVIVVL